ncbi:MAG: hypothetical protein K2P95_09780, partial [Hyphomonadaceae bacterium]|nr:hypothetical protein [Hyphomonadaceae bacterium]
APLAGAREEAERLIGRPVAFQMHELPGAFADLAAAEAAFPNLYLDPRFEAVFRDGAWRVGVRFWRPLQALPVGRSAREAARGGLGTARTQGEAEALLGGEAVLVEETLGLYTSPVRAEAACRRLGLATAGRVGLVQGRHALLLRFWRLRAAPAPLQERLEAPLRPRAPQASPFVGLFEQLAPENPAVILAEEGDGRCGD